MVVSAEGTALAFCMQQCGEVGEQRTRSTRRVRGCGVLVVRGGRDGGGVLGKKDSGVQQSQIKNKEGQRAMKTDRYGRRSSLLLSLTLKLSLTEAAMSTRVVGCVRRMLRSATRLHRRPTAGPIEISPRKCHRSRGCKKSPRQTDDRQADARKSPQPTGGVSIPVRSTSTFDVRT